MLNEEEKRALGKRATTIEFVLESLRNTKEGDVLIVETGCARTTSNYEGDGQSTVLWDRFATVHGGQVFSVDIDPSACAYAQSVTSGHSKVFADDSVRFLKRLADNPELRSRGVDLLYLDSYDVDFRAPHESALHHLSELTAAMPLLRDGSIILVDDSPSVRVSYSDDGEEAVVGDSYIGGKGLYVAEFLNRIGADLVIQSYQAAWRVTNLPMLDEVNYEIPENQVSRILDYETVLKNKEALQHELKEAQECARKAELERDCTIKAIEGARSELESVYSSYSWRWTSYLRRIRGIAGRAIRRIQNT